MNIRFSEIERNAIVDLGQQTLWEDDAEDSREALKYLRERRHLSDDVIKEFRFGYVPKRIRHDWSERIVMPLYDAYGELVVLTSRKITGDPKYSHLHETFDKRYYLFGLDTAKPAILQKNRAIIVEGQFDVTYLRTRGLKTVVGVLGSAFTMEHACMLRRYCNEIFLVFDGDEAGRATLERSLDMLREEQLESSHNMIFIPVRLPSACKDPDDYVREKGPKAFCQLLEDSKAIRYQYSA